MFIDADLPLLLSKEAMKKADTKIDFQTDKVNILGKDMEIRFTLSGHYAIPIKKNLDKVYINVNNLSTKTVEEKEKIAEKLHKQSGHATGDKLCSLIKSSKYRDHVLLEKVKGIEQRCNTCLKYKKPALRPVVGLSLAKDFNEVVAMDLKDIRGKKILHMIDHATRYAAAAVVKSKEKGEIVDKIFRHWIALFGPPRKFLCDNGVGSSTTN